MSLEEAIAFFIETLASVSFREVYNTPRVIVWLPGWDGYYVERDTVIEAAEAAKERRESVSSWQDRDRESGEA